MKRFIIILLLSAMAGGCSQHLINGVVVNKRRVETPNNIFFILDVEEDGIIHHCNVSICNWESYEIGDSAHQIGYYLSDSANCE